MYIIQIHSLKSLEIINALQEKIYLVRQTVDANVNFTIKMNCVYDDCSVTVSERHYSVSILTYRTVQLSIFYCDRVLFTK